MREKDGGPAFPEIRICQEKGTDPAYVPPVRVYCPGMSLRDYFAAKAMAALLPVREAGCRVGPGAARDAYEMADAMLAEREKNL